MAIAELAEMRAFSFCTGHLKHANFLRETRNDCRFSGVEAVFALEIPMFRANRKLVPMSPKFRKHHEMHGIYMPIFHVLHGVRGKKPPNSEKSVRCRTFWASKMLTHDNFFDECKRKALRVEFLYRICSIILARVPRP